MSSKLYFEPIKEKYENYFIEYRPPLHDFLFATLHINYLYDVEAEQVVSDLEKYAMKWVERYPVSVMASAFDMHGALINLKGAGKQSHLIALNTGKLFKIHWESIPDSAFPTEVLDAEFLLFVYSDIVYRTQDEVTESALEKLKPIRRLKVLLLVWGVFIPALIAILGFFSPSWVAVIALLYSLWQAYQKYLLMTGRKTKTERETEKEREELKIRHHHYHCEKNPDAFIRLRSENLKNEAKERIENEFQSLPKNN